MKSMKALLRVSVLVAFAAVSLAVVHGSEPAGEDKSRDVPKQFLPPAPAGQTWKLAWADEFGGEKIDDTKWNLLGDWKRRDGYWVKQDSYLDDKGHLIVRTTRDGERFTSGALHTKGKFDHRFGYWECRCKLPTQPGHWPAFWLFSHPGVTTVGDEGRDGTEIDIMEKPWRDARVQHALHWDGYGRHHKSKGKRVDVPGVSKGFHTFGLDWKPDEYVFYIDGKETWRTRAGGVSQVKAFVKLSEEIGEWGGDIRKANLPDYFTVDYVRVFDLVPQDE